MTNASFCISVLALLLPLSLSCDSQRLLQGVRNDEMTILRTHLDNARDSIASLLQNLSCRERKHKIGCTSDNPDFLGTLLKLACKMKKLQLSHTERLASVVLNLIRCSCPETPTKDPNLKLRRKRTTRPKRNGQRQGNREARKLCRAKAILSYMTECYQMLNSRH